MTNSIASESLFCQRPGEERFEITGEIDAPYPVGVDSEDWTCPVVIRPLYKKLQDAHGSSSLQALCLAIALALDLLDGFKEKGGVLTCCTGEAFPLEAYSFGVTAKRSYGQRDAQADGPEA